ncbi:MAG: sigma-70 family RNA polymerase sigma factor, partial [Gammaproteobacteria bacterium]
AEIGFECYNATVNAGTETTEFDAQEIALRGLISGIAGKEEAALSALYDATTSRVFALALRITGQRNDAEEVTEDVYLQVWQRAGAYDPKRGKIMTWLYTICRSRAIDLLRRRNPAEICPSPEMPCEDTDLATDPLDALSGLEEHSRVRAALEALSVNERQMLVLSYFKGFSHQEIADYAATPLGTVKTVLRRAMQLMKERLMAVEARGMWPRREDLGAAQKSAPVV